VFLVALLAAMGCGETGATSSAERQPAPEFYLERLGGGSVQLSALRGRTVILDFWATWCPPCEFQVPELNAFFDAHREEGDVEVLGISVDTDGADVIGAWVAEKEVRYPVLMGDEDLARRYGAIGFPTLIIVSPSGAIDSVHVGLIESAELEAALSRLRASG
jgi:thiol-disulfide isomerase/thioredoxin